MLLIARGCMVGRWVLEAQDRLFEVLDIAWQAADTVMEVYHGGFEVVEKADDSPLTRADIAAHTLIERQLMAFEPSMPVLSEESGEWVKAQRHQWNTFWLVDPLDGTKEFVKRSGEFTVNIALVQNNAPTLSVIVAPATATAWYAVRGAGAWRAARGESGGVIHCASWRSGRTTRLVGSRSHHDDRTERLLQRLVPWQWQGLGSSLKFCRIAEGGADVYPRFGPTCEWDTAAGQLILEEAGGLLLRLGDDGSPGSPLDYNRRETLINPAFVALSSEALRDRLTT